MILLIILAKYLSPNNKLYAFSECLIYFQYAKQISIFLFKIPINNGGWNKNNEKGLFGLNSPFKIIKKSFNTARQNTEFECLF